MDLLRNAYKSKRIISVCLHKVDWDKRVLGYIRAFKKESIVVQEVDIFGDVVRERSIALSAIRIVETGDRYNLHLERLKAVAKRLKKVKPLFYVNSGERFAGKLALLTEKECVCTLFWNTEFMTGIIKEVTANSILVETVGYTGIREGESWCSLKGMTRIRYQGPREAKIDYLLNGVNTNG